MIFSNRREAGILLAKKLSEYHENPKTIVLGLARGGIPVAYEAAAALNLPLNVLVPRKIGAPFNPELAIGAIVEFGSGYFNKALIQSLQVSPEYIENEISTQQAIAKERVALYRKNALLTELENKTVIIIDDGIATGATMFAAIGAVRELGASKVIAAVPVGAADSLKQLCKLADDVVCVHPSENLGAIGFFYERFDQTSDEEVITLLERAKNR